MLSTSSLNGKLDAIYIKDVINLVHNSEVVWDEQTINNRIFQKIALYGDFDLVKTMVLDSKFNLNLSEIPVFFYEKITTKKYKNIFLFLFENHFIDKHINDLFVYCADKKLSLIRRFLPQIHSSFVVEKALISCIYKDNLDNFVYIWTNNITDKKFNTNFLEICIRKKSVNILDFLLPTLPQENIQDMFNELIYDYYDDNYFNIFNVFLKHNAQIPNLSPEFVCDLIETFYKFKLFHYLLKQNYIIPSHEIFDNFVNSESYNMAKNFDDYGDMYISIEEQETLNDIYNLLSKDNL